MGSLGRTLYTTHMVIELSPGVAVTYVTYARSHLNIQPFSIHFDPSTFAEMSEGVFLIREQREF